MIRRPAARRAGAGAGGVSASNHRTEDRRKCPSLVRVIKSVAFCALVAPVMLVVLFIGEVFLWIVEARE